MPPRKILKIRSSQIHFQRFEMVVEDVYFFKIHPNFGLTSENEEETKKEFGKRSWGQQLRGTMDRITKSTQQSNRTEVIPAVLKIDGTRHLKIDKQVNLLLFSPLGHNCDFKFSRHLKYYPMQSTND